MSDVVGVVHVRAAEGKAEEVIAAFTTCIEKTHEEEGCLLYALHRDNADPHHLVLLERWRSQEDLDAHFATPPIRTTSCSSSAGARSRTWTRT